jgi:hypothetical protein
MGDNEGSPFAARGILKPLHIRLIHSTYDSSIVKIFSLLRVYISLLNSLIVSVYNESTEIVVHPVSLDLAILVTIPLMSQASMLKLAGLAILAFLFVVTVVVLVNQPDGAIQCNQKSKPCVDACFSNLEVLVGLRGSTEPFAANSTLLTCLGNCPNSNTCEGNDALFQAIPQETQIFLQFRAPGSSYDIYLNNQLVGSAIDGKPYVIQNLTSATPYAVAIREKGSKEIEITYLYTLREDQNDIDQEITMVTQVPTNETSSEERDKLFYSSYLHIHVNKHRIILTVHGYVPHDNPILEVYRNDEFLGTMAALSFIDREIKPGEVYHYSVRGSINITQPEMEQRKRTLTKRMAALDNETFANETFVNETIDGLADLQRDHYQLERSDVYTIESIQLFDYRKVNIQASNANGPYYLRYMTFIPYKYVSNPFYVTIYNHEPIKTKYFNGNNRGFQATIPIENEYDYKTWAEVKVDFAKKKVGSNVHVGRTVGYDKNHKRIWSETADYDCMELIGKDLSKLNRYTWFFYHSCAIPYPTKLIGGFLPDIDYRYYAKVWKSGSWEVQGIHDQTPSHEMYIAREGNKGKVSGWKPVHTWKCSKYFKLGLTLQTVRISNSGETPK